LQGDQATLLADKNSIVISDDLAIRLFGTTDNVLGRSVVVQHEHEYIVSGLMQVPSNSSLQFDFVISFEKFKDIIGANFNWGSTGPPCYVLLRSGSDVDSFSKKIANYVRVKTNNEVTHRTPFIRRYSDAYLYGKYENGVVVGGRITYVKLFSVIAIFILIIACINFMNLSTAKAFRRIKEVGIKKAVGAARKVIMAQYFGESLLLTFVSLFLAVLIVQMLLPSFNVITEKQLTLALSQEVILGFVAIALFTGVISGSYPSIYLSHFNPATVLRGKIHSPLGELLARKGLVVFQFALSVILIVSVLVIYRQIDFLQSKPLGYDRNNLINFPMEGKMRENREAFLSELTSIPGVVNAAAIAHRMTGHVSGTYGVAWEGKDPNDKTEFENVSVDYNAIETLGFEVIQGRSFSRDFPSDSAAIIFNQAGIDFMGMTDPIGKTIKLWGEDRKIIGVVENFHFESLHKRVGPLFLRLDPDNTYLFMARIDANKQKETIDQIGKLFKKFNPEFAFDFSFLDEEYRSQYAAEERVSILSRYFAGLAVLISCLGLIGLAAFSAERRQKEIGIRKALGASVAGILVLLTGDFARIVTVAIVVGLPSSYFVVSNWLESFAFRIDLNAWYFIAAGVVALLIAVLTVAAQSFKAANISPSNCLRNE
jgi:ABC-type antimicrobial peptide transport system permease subunit